MLQLRMTAMRARMLSLVVLVIACSAACSSKTNTAAGSTSDALSADSASSKCQDPTPALETCYAGWCLNPYHVGMPCTKGGSECTANNSLNGQMGAILCTANQDPTSAFCTLPCVDDSDCGLGATCVGSADHPTAGKGCILTACLAGSDASGTGDAVTTAADVTSGAAGGGADGSGDAD